jgi:hypothetical protein
VRAGGADRCLAQEEGAQAEAEAEEAPPLIGLLRSPDSFSLRWIFRSPLSFMSV